MGACISGGDTTDPPCKTANHTSMISTLAGDERITLAASLAAKQGQGTVHICSRHTRNALEDDDQTSLLARQELYLVVLQTRSQVSACSTTM